MVASFKTVHAGEHLAELLDQRHSAEPPNKKVARG